MGVEGYGLVGFFAMLQVWFQLLDMGLTSTMGRESARFNGGAINSTSYKSLLRLMEIFFVSVAAIGVLGIILGASPIANHWLKVQKIDIEEVINSIILMGLIVGLRWVSGLYRSVIIGLESMVWISWFGVLVSTARFVLVIPVFLYVGTSVINFFSYQLIIAILELIILINHAYKFLPKLKKHHEIRMDVTQLKEIIKFSLSIAFTSSVWVIVTQTDKLIMSTLLELSEYAYFTLAILVAGGVGIISGPISTAIMPRLSRLAAEKDSNLIPLYRSATQLVAVFSLPTSLILAVFSYKVLWLWTSNEELAGRVAPILSLYALGNGVLALGSFPYYLQYAKGNLRLHLIGSVIFLIILIPMLIFGASRFGAMGAGWAWVGANLMYLFFWVPVVHRRLMSGLHLKWIFQDIFPIALISIIGVFLLKFTIKWPTEKFSSFLVFIVLSILVFTLSAIGSSFIRGQLLLYLKKGKNFEENIDTSYRS